VAGGCNPSYSEGRDWDNKDLGQLGQGVHETSSQKKVGCGGICLSSQIPGEYK
jgi:hypothetical protein